MRKNTDNGTETFVNRLGTLRRLGLIAAGTGSMLSLVAIPVVAEAATSHATINVNATKHGSLGTILATAKGFTLYTFKEDTANHSNCTGACATEWPPYLVPKGDTVKAGTGVSGLTTITRSNGTKQVAYKGKPLYTFAGDKKAGQDNGQAVEKTWYVVVTKAATTAAKTTTSPTTAPTSASSGGYGY